MYDDLMAVARQLATLEKIKPRQATLRRAVSTAYYALFHYLVEESRRVQLGAGRAQRQYRFALARAFVHTTMKDACRSFAGGSLPEQISLGLPKSGGALYVVPSAIRNIAKRFVYLQETRHLADYELRERFKRSDVLKLIEATQVYVDDFRRMDDSDDRRFFLICLTVWKELTKR